MPITILPTKREEQPIGTSTPMAVGQSAQVATPVQPTAPGDPNKKLPGSFSALADPSTSINTSAKAPVKNVAPKAPVGPVTGSAATVPPIGAPSAANGFGDQSSLLPQTAGQAGTGFVNLSRVLGANLGAGAGVTGAANGKLAKEFANRQRDEGSFINNRAGAVANSSLGGFNFSGTPDILGDALGDPNKQDMLRRSLAGLDFDKTYSRDKSAEMKDLEGLSNGQTAGRVLAKDAGVTGGYSPKLSALDSLIYGGNSAAAGDVAGTANATGAEKTNATKMTGDINKATETFRQQALDRAQGNAGALRQAAAGYGQEAQIQADRINQRDADLGLGNATAGQFEYGDNPNAAKSRTIAQLLGDPSLEMHGSGGAYDPTAAANARAVRAAEVGAANVMPDQSGALDQQLEVARKSVEDYKKGQGTSPSDVLSAIFGLPFGAISHANNDSALKQAQAKYDELQKKKEAYIATHPEYLNGTAQAGLNIANALKGINS